MGHTPILLPEEWLYYLRQSDKKESIGSALSMPHSAKVADVILELTLDPFFKFGGTLPLALMLAEGIEGIKKVRVVESEL